MENDNKSQLIQECEALFRKIGAAHLEATYEVDRAKIVLLDALKIRTAITDQHIVFMDKKYVPAWRRQEKLWPATAKF